MAISAAAHDVSVMVIQAGAARRAADVDRQAAHEALRHVETCGREALAELRRMIGIVRRGEMAFARPGLSQLSRLAERSQAAGLAVDVVIGGEPRPPPAVPGREASRGIPGSG